MDSMNPNRLYISDLDGTLLRSNGRLSDYSRDQLARLVEAGLPFTVASARTWSEIKPLLEGVPIRLPVIAVNGAFLSEFESGRPRVINELPHAVSKRLYEMILKAGLLPFVCAVDRQQEAMYYQDLVNPQMEWFYGILTTEGHRQLRQVDDLRSVLDLNVVSFATMGPHDTIRDLYHAAESAFEGQLENFFFENPYTPGHWWLTLHDRRSCKSIAMTELAGLLEVPLEHVTVFGDHLNDIRMFERAGHGVAVANAHDKLKGIASEIIGTNEEDAVVRYLTETARL